jgi:hypothetical protein
MAKETKSVSVGVAKAENEALCNTYKCLIISPGTDPVPKAIANGKG